MQRTTLLSPIVEENIWEKNQRNVVIDDIQPLTRCTALYLGTAIPTTDERGIDSIQEPLLKRYPTDRSETIRGIEVWLSIDNHGLQIQYVSDPSVILYYPIRSLVYCASIRFVTERTSSNSWCFCPLDAPDALLPNNAQNPPLFSVVLQRTRQSPMDECHCFVIKTKQNALALVQACSDAYQVTDEHQDCSKVPLYFKMNEDGTQMQEIDDEVVIVPAKIDEDIIDYQINRQSAGFFYKTPRVFLDHWQLNDNPKHTLHRSSSNRSMKSTSSTHRQQEYSEPSLPTIDPYASDPNILRIERIQDPETGREIYIRFVQDSSQSPAPNVHLPTYDFQFEKNFETLNLNNQSETTTKKHHKHKKSKKKKSENQQSLDLPNTPPFSYWFYPTQIFYQ